MMNHPPIPEPDEPPREKVTLPQVIAASFSRQTLGLKWFVIANAISCLILLGMIIEQHLHR